MHQPNTYPVPMSTERTSVYSFCNAPAQHVSCANVYREDRCLQLLQCTSQNVSCANVYREDRCLQLLQCTSPTRILCQCLQRGQVSTASAMHQPNTYLVPISTERTGVYSFCNATTRILCQCLQRGQVSTIFVLDLASNWVEGIQATNFQGLELWPIEIKTVLLRVESCVYFSRNYTVLWNSYSTTIHTITRHLTPPRVGKM